MRIRRGTLLSVITLLALCVGAEGNDGMEDHVPIVILSDAEFTAENGVRDGTGTIDDPYVISNWRIDAKRADHCIRIENVSSAFRIEDCVLVGASVYAARLVGVERAELVGSCVSASVFGVVWEWCTRCSVCDCSFDEIDWEAVTLVGSTGCEVTGCLFVEGGPAIELRERSTGSKFVGNVFLPECRTGIRFVALSGGNLIACNDFHGPVCASESYNRWNDTDGNGNYWSRYHGPDRDGDGVGDTSFIVLGGARELDRHPAMSPLHPGAATEWDRCGPER